MMLSFYYFRILVNELLSLHLRINLAIEWVHNLPKLNLWDLHVCWLDVGGHKLWINLWLNDLPVW